MVDMLSSPSPDFTPVPLDRMSCLQGAAFDAASNTIISPGGITGFSIYGPYLPVDAGFYDVKVDISTAGTKHPRVHVELWNGEVLSKRDVQLERSTLTLTAWIPARTVLEIRFHTRNTEFTVHNIAARRLDPHLAATSEATEAERISRRQQFRAAIAFGHEEPAPDAPSAEALLDSIVGDAAFVWADETQLSAHEALLHRSGINPTTIHYIFSSNNSSRFEPAGAAAPLTGGYPHYTNQFQLQALRDGFIEFPSPFGGENIKSDVSFPIFAPGFGVTAVLYEFSGPHHIIVGTAHSWSGAISFMWFVDHDLLVHDPEQESLCEWAPILPILRSFVRMCASRRALAFNYRCSTKNAACFGGCNSNLGHYFWNDVSGVERVVRSGLRPAFVLGKSKRLSLEQIFLEDDIEVVECEVETAEHLFELTLENKLLLVRPTGNTIDVELAAKVERAALRLARSSAGERECLRDVEGNAFVVFYNLRAHNKAWIEQVDGAVELVNRLRSELQYEKVVLFLDGYEDCAAIVGQIKDKVGSSCLVIDGTRLSFPETLIWAYRCDFFVAVIGSGLVLLTWLAAKSGICHGDRRHMAQLGWWGSVRPNAGTLLSPAMSEIIDTQDHFYTNYNLDPSIVSNLAVEFLKRHMPHDRAI
ncbi:hypothetical protein RHAL1_00384 [Beijerinckiaceae bacterium RH AL1]|nr:hypothetical protein RHAL8_00364 [Beijerinckiaceae bacterium RH AL8]VVB42799.1 hypothetical protein RHCH11_RHCH11_00366 [Beijerinckiaceae bacterium RH CH11]VVC53503.1 hypothetical protein RHAL1_00384 [Beijerinckiaceae bacterium RH AL1]